MQGATECPEELGIVLAKHFAAYVRPEFLEFVGQAIVENQKTKGGCVSGSGSVLRGVVDIRDCRGRSIADGFGIVETRGACISTTDE